MTSVLVSVQVGHVTSVPVSVSGGHVTPVPVSVPVGHVTSVPVSVSVVFTFILNTRSSRFLKVCRKLIAYK